MKTNRITLWVGVALFCGFALGTMIHHYSWQLTTSYETFKSVLDIGSYAFLSLLKLLVVPVVLVSLLVGVGSTENIVRLGRMGFKTLSLYILTTAMALVIAILLALLVNPGEGLELGNLQVIEFKPANITWVDTVKSMIPSNIMYAFINQEMMQIIFIAIILGVAIAKSQPKGKRVLEFFEDLNHVMNEWVNLTLLLAPIGVFCLMTDVFAKQGIAFLGPLASYFAVVLLALVLHVVLIYFGLLKLVGGMSPWRFIEKFKSVMLLAFSTSSSQATLSLNMLITEKDLGVSPQVASFTLPLGSTVNMDGTAIMQGVATVFIAQVYAVDLSVSQLVGVVVMATLASIGTAGVPGVGLVTLSMVLSYVGLPIEGIGLILGVDRVLDMSRTVVNITGDAIVTLLVAKSENHWNRGAYEA